MNESTVASYVALLRQPDGVARRQAWIDQYEAAHQDVFDVYYSSWGDPRLRDQAADAVEEQVPFMASRERQVLQDAAESAEQLRKMGLLTGAVPVVTMVGVHTANGWATLFRGRQTLFIALEYLTDTIGDTILVTHETIHAAHHILNPALPMKTVGERLIGEGLATNISRVVHPGHPESEYFWFDDRRRPWVHECELASERIIETARDSLDQDDDGPDERLFSTGHSDGLPPRSGYWLADQLIKTITETGGLTHRDMMTWEPSEVADRVRQGLETLRRRPDMNNRLRR